MRFFISRLTELLAERVLQANPSKCDVIPSAGAARNASGQIFAGWKHVADCSFKLLGAPIGSASFCAQQVAARVTKARALLERIGEYEDLQGGMHLLRHCVSWSKLIYSSRTVPQALVAGPLRDYDMALRENVGAIAGQPLPETVR